MTRLSRCSSISTTTVRATAGRQLASSLCLPACCPPPPPPLGVAEDSPWTGIGLDDLNSTYSQAVAYDAALQGMVLLKNAKSALPIKQGVKLAVVGPMVRSVGRRPS